MTALLRVYQFRDHDHVGYHGLSITQCYVIDCLLDRGELTLNQLADEIGLDKSTLSRAVDGLERKRFATKRRNPLDGRSALLRATTAGARRYGPVQDDIIRENCRVLAAFPPRVRSQIAPVLDALTKAVAKRRVAQVDV
jgi:DNA-binding MarR family transcriptional regulator